MCSVTRGVPGRRLEDQESSRKQCVIPFPRLRAATVPALVLLLAVTGCTSTPPSPDPTATESQEIPGVVLSTPDAEQRQVLAGAPAEASIRMSAALFESSPVAVVFARQAAEGFTRTDGALGAAAGAATGLRVPLLLVGADGEGLADVTAELDRLGAGTVIGYGDPAAGSCSRGPPRPPASRTPSASPWRRPRWRRPSS